MDRKHRRAVQKLKGKTIQPGRDARTAIDSVDDMLAVALKYHQAERLYRKILLVDSSHSHSLHLLGVIAYERGQHTTAFELINRAIELNNGVAEFYNNLGTVLKAQGKLIEAGASFEHAITLKPAYALAHNNLGTILRDQGKPAEAVACFERTLALKSDYPEAYVSPDFRSHSVAYFIEPLLREHDRHLVEIYCYADVLRPDAVTEPLRGYADYWVETIGYPTTASPNAFAPIASTSWSIWPATPAGTGLLYLPVSQPRFR